MQQQSGFHDPLISISLNCEENLLIKSLRESFVRYAFARVSKANNLLLNLLPTICESLL